MSCRRACEPPRHAALPSGLIRRAVAEIGRRLTDRATITTAEEAVFLQDRELHAALHGGKPRSAGGGQLVLTVRVPVMPFWACPGTGHR
jgi:hypothetical protein